MRIKLIGCKVFTREMYRLCSVSPNRIEIVWMPTRLHTNPQKELAPALQEMIDRVETGEDAECDAICLGYGLCSMGIVGLHSSRFPLVVPRVHDCITLLLGSRERYQELFDAHSGGIYWYSAGWIEQFKTPGRGYDEQARYMDYVERFGEDNAQYLIETEREWTKNYDCAVLIRWNDIDRSEYADFTRRAAQEGGLDYLEETGSDCLLKKMTDGNWDDDFLIVPPGHRIVYTGDERLIDCVPMDEKKE